MVLSAERYMGWIESGKVLFVTDRKLPYAAIVTLCSGESENE